MPTPRSGRSSPTSRRSRFTSPPTPRSEGPVMRAAVLHAPHDLRVEDRPEPEVGAGDVLVEVRLNGLCGTDATEYTKGPMMVPLTVPHRGSGHVGATILGHEFIGTVVATSS